MTDQSGTADIVRAEIERWESDKRTSYPDSEVLASLDRIRASLQPATPTACPTSDPKWPEGEPCSVCGAFGPWFDTPQIGECVEATGGDAVAGDAKALADEIEACQTSLMRDNLMGANLSLILAALRTPDVAGDVQAARAPDHEDCQTILEILDEIRIDRNIGAEHRFSNEWWLVIERCLNGSLGAAQPSCDRIYEIVLKELETKHPIPTTVLLAMRIANALSISSTERCGK